MAAERTTLGIIQGQLARQEQSTQVRTGTQHLASEAVDFLNREGHVGTFYVNRVFSFMLFPIILLARLGDMSPVSRAHQRFLQYDQATYICRILKEDGLQTPIVLFANDGDPSRAKSLQIGAINTTEYLHIDKHFGRTDALVLCTETDPRFPNIAPAPGYTGSRFDGSSARVVRAALLDDLQDYSKLLSTLEGLGKETEPKVRLPFIRPLFGYLPLSPFY